MTIILPNIRDRHVLQRLLSGEWKSLVRIRIDTAVGDLQLKRLFALGWIEQREYDGKAEIRITSEGLSAFRMPKR